MKCSDDEFRGVAATSLAAWQRFILEEAGRELSYSNAGSERLSPVEERTLHLGEQRVGFRWPPFFVGGGSRVTGTLPRISAGEQIRTTQKML